MFGVASNRFGRIKGPKRVDCVVVDAKFISCSLSYIKVGALAMI